MSIHKDNNLIKIREIIFVAAKRKIWNIFVKA